MGSITYTTIIHQAREKLGLSLNEYAVVDIIYQLQNNPNSSHPGWCYASKKTLGDCVGISEQAIHSILKKLYDKGYLEKQDETKHIRANSTWYNTVVAMKSELKENTKETLVTLKKLEPNTKETLVDDTKETLVNNNISNNYKNKYNTFSYLEDIPLKDMEEFTLAFNITASQLKDKAETLADYCRAKGRKYKDYKAFLRNAIRKEFTKRKPRVVPPWEKLQDIPDEVRKANIEKMAEMKAKIGVKQ